MHFAFLFLLLLSKEIFFLFLFMEYKFFDYKQYVGAGTITLMSISDGSGPSVFCRKTERVRPVRAEIDGKVDYFPPESAFLTFLL